MKKLELTDKQLEVLDYIVEKISTAELGDHSYWDLVAPSSPKAFDIVHNIYKKIKKLKNTKTRHRKNWGWTMILDDPKNIPY